MWRRPAGVSRERAKEAGNCALLLARFAVRDNRRDRLSWGLAVISAASVGAASGDCRSCLLSRRPRSPSMKTLDQARHFGLPTRPVVGVALPLHTGGQRLIITPSVVPRRQPGANSHRAIKSLRDGYCRR
jgi:hypothetical protein